MVPLAIALVRAWTRLYTWPLEPGARDARRAEIESDLWEFSRDLHGRPRLHAALSIVGRLLLGATDDLAWLFEEGAHMSIVRTSIWLVSAAIVGATLWTMFDVMRARPLPLPPAPPEWKFVAGPPTRLPPPPPPPPRSVFPNTMGRDKPPVR